MFVFFCGVFVVHFFHTLCSEFLFFNDERVAFQWKRKIKFKLYPCFLTEHIFRYAYLEHTSIE